MPSIESRILRLAEEAERRRLLEEEPTDQLSQSIYEYNEWWESLNEQERQNHIDNLDSD